MVQWLRICWPVQETWVQSMVQEDPTCFGATKPVSHNYWSPRLWSPCPTTKEVTAMRSPWTTRKSSSFLPQLEKASVQQQRHSAVKSKLKKKKRVRTLAWGYLGFESWPCPLLAGQLTSLGLGFSIHKMGITRQRWIGLRLKLDKQVKHLAYCLA